MNRVGPFEKRSSRLRSTARGGGQMSRRTSSRKLTSRQLKLVEHKYVKGLRTWKPA